jgi:hypothetical protein
MRRLGAGRDKELVLVVDERFEPLSCSPFQDAGTIFLLLPIERFQSTSVRQGERHDHENDG